MRSKARGADAVSLTRFSPLRLPERRSCSCGLSNVVALWLLVCARMRSTCRGHVLAARGGAQLAAVDQDDRPVSGRHRQTSPIRSGAVSWGTSELFELMRLL